MPRSTTSTQQMSIYSMRSLYLLAKLIQFCGCISYITTFIRRVKYLSSKPMKSSVNFLTSLLWKSFLPIYTVDYNVWVFNQTGNIIEMYNIIISSVKCIYYYFLHARSLSTMATTDLICFFESVLKSQTLLKEINFVLLRSLTCACSYWGHGFCVVDKQVL